jgi:PIN domain nuclease of toxin-antitoxin system
VIPKNGIGGNLALIFDTHVLFWLATGHPRLSPLVADALADEQLPLFISAITAYEYTDLCACGRLPRAPTIDSLRSDFSFELLAFPLDAWRIAAELPDIHRDPIDRMLVAHAIYADLTLVSADAQVRQYPVRSLW